jgi:hypothetical protein
MHLSVCIPLAMQTQRLRGLDPRNYHAFFWCYMFLSTCLFWFFTLWDIPIQHTIILQIVAIIVLELICKFREGTNLEMKWFWVSLGLMLIAQTFSQLDLKRRWWRKSKSSLPRSRSTNPKAKCPTQQLGQDKR